MILDNHYTVKRQTVIDTEHITLYYYDIM